MALCAKRWGESAKSCWTERVQFPRANEAQASLPQQATRAPFSTMDRPCGARLSTGWSRLGQQVTCSRPTAGGTPEPGCSWKPVVSAPESPPPATPRAWLLDVLVLEVKAERPPVNPGRRWHTHPSAGPLANQQRLPEAPPGSSAHAQLSMHTTGSRTPWLRVASGPQHGSRRPAGRIPPSNRWVGRRCRSPQASRAGRVPGQESPREGRTRRGLTAQARAQKKKKPHRAGPW